MARGIKQSGTGEDNDFSITDAQKRIRTRRRQLDRATDPESNSIDDLSDELDNQGESDYVRTIFDD